VGRELKVAGSTAHRLLAMLELHEFVVRDPTSRDYLPGPALVKLGLKVAAGSDLRTAALPEMEALSAETKETVSIGVLLGTDILFVESIESLQAVRVTSMAGSVFPAHATSAGKVLLAQLSVERLKDLYPNERLVGGTARAVQTRTEMIRELTTIKERGVAVNRGESDDVLGTIAVALFDAEGQPRGSLSISMPLPRFEDADEAALAVKLTRAAKNVQGRLSPARWSSSRPS
jgi:IclR family acetate operon transcriptional repressor